MPLAIASSGNPMSLELARGDLACCFCRQPARICFNKQTRSKQWNKVEAIAAERRCRATSRDNSRHFATCVYPHRSQRRGVARCRGEHRPRHGVFRRHRLESALEYYPGQPFSEITARSGADKQHSIIGTPDDAIKQIKRMQDETGGFGGFIVIHP